MRIRIGVIVCLMGLILSGCAGLPKRKVDPCRGPRELVDVSLFTGSVVGLSSLSYAIIVNRKFDESPATYMMLGSIGFVLYGIGLKYYLNNYTDCPDYQIEWR